MADDIPFDTREDGDALGDLRALIPDMEQLPEPSNPNLPASYLFSDSVLGRYLRLHGSTIGEDGQTWTATLAQVKRATADAYMALATSEMLILKKITSQDRSTDGSVLANQYRQMAKQLRDEADQLDQAEDEEPGVFVARYRPRPAAFDGEYAARRGSRWG
jgi:hypothetical protein